MSSYQELIYRVKHWGINNQDIRSIIIVGSMARSEKPADEWADLDLVVIAANHLQWLADEQWLLHIGTPLISFLEESPVAGLQERRVLFDSNLAVDFNFLPVAVVNQLFTLQEAQEVFALGANILVDKDGIVTNLLETPFKPRQLDVPDYAVFKNDCHDFWFHAVLTAKKLRRGEVLAAKSCCDNYMKQLLLQLLKWHAISKKNSAYLSWHGFRFFEDWVDPAIHQQIYRSYAKYDKEDIWLALFETTALYGKLASELAKTLQFQYSKIAEDTALALIEKYYKNRTC